MTFPLHKYRTRESAQNHVYISVRLESSRVGLS